MKVNGKDINGPKIVSVVIPVGDNDFVEFRFRCVTDKDDFVAIAPEPVPPQIIRPGKGRTNNITDPNYVKSLRAWSEQLFHFKILKSMDATPGLEWYKVKMGDPSTYHLWQEEINESFGRNVSNVLFTKYKEANVLDEEMLEEARKTFLLLQATEQNLLSSLPSAPATTLSGDPANVSASDRQA